MRQVVQILLLFGGGLGALSTTAQAEDLWGPAIMQHTSQYVNEFDDEYVASLVGQCDFDPPSFSEIEDQWGIPSEEKKVTSWYFREGYLTIRESLQKNTAGEITPAPLIFFIPGAFSNLEDPSPRRMTRDLVSRGYHLVNLPNPWGTDYIAHHPKHSLGHYLKEGKSLYQVIRRVHRRLQEEGALIDEVQLVGVSYGGFLTSLIMGLDAESPTPIFNQPATVFSPPFNLAATLDNLDNDIRAIQGEYTNMPLWRAFLIKRSLCLKKRWSEFGEEDLADAKGLSVYFGFQRSLVFSLVLFDQIKRLGMIPDRRWGLMSSDYRRWRRYLTFGSYLRKHSPDVLALLQEPQGDLFYWKELAETSPSHRIRLVVTDDDFLNRGHFWARDYGAMITLQNGGHYGYRGVPWFSDFLGLLFTPYQ